MGRINTNVPALIALNQLQRSSGELQTTLERLSSGLRINRGADDPAGLIVSENLRSEIAGMRQAIANTQRASNTPCNWILGPGRAACAVVKWTILLAFEPQSFAAIWRKL